MDTQTTDKSAPGELNKSTTPKARSTVLEMSDAKESQQMVNNPTPELRTFAIKLGWIQGVLVPCLLNIWGVMLFLRIAWVVAQAGIGNTLAYITLSSVVCVITTLSLSAICTNGVVQGGGVYYLVSRSLGAEMGASVGIMFAFANAVAASMNTIGFCDSLNALLRRYDAKIFENDENDVRLIGTIMLLIMCLICAIGMDWETKTQNFLIVVIVLAIVNYVVGACIGPTSDEQRAKGFVGISAEVAAQNWKSDFRFAEGQHHDFFSVFAMYFPAVTGIQAGANICGDLREPAKAIPKGTLLAMLISTISYITMAVLCGVAGLRDASGDVSKINDREVLAACKPNCEFGLHNNYEMMQLMSGWDMLIFFGCWAATLSTALTNLLAVPRLIQALGQDQIYPGLIFFSKPYGKHGEPYRGYVLTFFISLAFLLIADLNTIAPLITNFYLASYALINFCTFHADFIKHISWRPQFRFYNKWLSFFGFAICVLIMMVISWMMALVTVLIFLTLYLLVLYRKPKANWGSSREAQQYRDAITFLLDQTRNVEAIKSYNPQFLVLAGKPYLRPALLDIGHIITKCGSFMIVADIDANHVPQQERIRRCTIGQKWLNYHKYRGFYVLLDGHNLENGVATLLQTVGLGRLTPNILLIGYLAEWQDKPHDAILEYVRTLQVAYDLHVALTLLRPPDSDHLLVKTSDTTRETSDSSETRNQLHAVLRADSEELIADNENNADSETAEQKEMKRMHVDPATDRLLSQSKSELTHSYSDMRGIHKPLMQPIYFPSHGGVLDAWWLYDDGGLNILLPYIMSRRGFKERMTLRIFALTRRNNDNESEEIKMAQLLDKFRIEYEELVIVQGLSDDPLDETWNFFNSIIENFKTNEYSETLITNEELKTLKPKTSRHLRLRELIKNYSSESTLIVLTMPLPRRGKVSAALYMAWLEVLTQGFPPVFFVRGNTESVIAT